DVTRRRETGDAGADDGHVDLPVAPEGVGLGRLARLVDPDAGARLLHGQVPVNRGGRRSVIALTPSRKSSVRWRRSCSARSLAVASLIRAARSSRIVSRIERTADGAD